MAFGRFAIQAMTACAVAALAAPADAAREARQQVDIRAGPLSAALREFARETGAELLFDQKVVGGISTRAVRGNFTRPEALSKLLEGTGVGFRSAGGSYVLFRDSEKRSPVPVEGSSGEGAEDESEEATLPEILVTGRRTQNTDIRRTQNDIQPYRVIERQEIESGHRESIEQIIRSREPINGQAISPAQSTTGGDTRSAFDFRGLGTLRSLVLVDGRRMPGNPTSEADFGQPDINGIPLGAVQRIETRTGTAGGIYGPGALGGVLNLVLRRDYEGAELRVTSGVTTRGDARTLRAEIGYGFSPNNGRTEVMLAAGHRRSVPLLQGQRDYAVRQRRLQFSNSPADYASLTPLTNAILVFGVGGENLRFDEKFGGDSLGSPVSYLPVGFSGTPEEARQLLRQNAGRTVFELAPDPSAALQHVVASPTITSLIANIRHQVSDTVEAYVDGLLLRNAGRQTSGGFGLRVTLPNAPTNPFDQFVRFAFPTALGPRSIRQQSTVARISGGLIIRLPGGWSANGDYTAGRATAARIVLFSRGSDDLQSGLQFGTPRSDGRIVDPLGPWDDLMSALAAYTAEGSSSSRLKNNFSDASLRLAGPVVNLPGGPMTTTFLLERRQEKIPDALEVSRSSKPDRVRETKIFERSQLVTSAYGELRAPLTAEGGLLGDLQIQLALRYDLSLSSMPNGVGSAALSPEERPKRSERGALTYTAGAQFQPIRRLMLRASLASGELPPSLAGLSATAVELGRASPASLGGSAEFPDPLRGGRSVGSERLVRVLFGGLKDAPPERAQTFSAGAVLNPKSRLWPRISVDYVRISRSRQPFLDRFQFELPWGSLPQLLAGTTDRLTRAPLTDADRTLGFTGGVITQADVRGLLLGSSIVEAVDVELDWSVKAGRFGTFRLYGRGTWQPTLRRQTVEGEPWFEDGDDIDGPLRWRGHGGIEWTRGASAIGINAQYFSSYRAAYGSFGDTTNGEIQRFQGSERISSQTYFDLNVRHRFSHILELSAGVINLFDRSPPIAADRFNVFGYSYHGDPRRRRLELALSKKF